MRILHRYIRNEFFQQFFLWGAVITVLGIGKIFFDYNDLFIGYRVTGRLLFILVINQLPSLFMDVIPFATLLGTLLSIGRLLRERELEVIRINGVSVIRMMLPIFSGVFLICLGAFFWNDTVVPAANHHFQEEVRHLSMQEDLPMLQENVVFKGPKNRFIYLNRVEHKLGRISGILIMETGQGNWPRIITASYGLLRRGIWELHDGVIHQIDQNGAITSELKYQRMDLQMASDFLAILSQDKSPGEMRLSDLLDVINTNKKSGQNTSVYIVFYHLKFADALISLVLAFLAVPLTLLIGRQSRWLGFVSCIIIILGYYTMQVIGRTLGANGLITPWVAAWAPHLLFLAIGLALLLKAEQWR